MFEEFEIIDVGAIEELHQTMGEKISRMFDYFVSDSAEYVRRVDCGFSSSDIKEIIESSHSLKSSSRLIGAIRLSNCAELIEFSAKEIEKASNIQEALPSLSMAIAELKKISEITLEKYKGYRAENNI